MQILLILVALLVHAANGLVGEGKVCLSCDKVVLPRDCDHVARCGKHEECGTTRYVDASGVVWYRVGCMSSQRCYGTSSHATIPLGRSFERVLCVNCCNDTDVCNQQGCGTNGFDPHYKVCYSCGQQLTPDSCDQIIICDQDQACSIAQSHFGPDTFYTSGCFPLTQCSSLGESVCCQSALCNTNLTAVHRPSSITASTVTSTHPTSTTHMSLTPPVAVCPSGWIPGLHNTTQYCRHEDAGLVPWQTAKVNTNYDIVNNQDTINNQKSGQKDKTEKRGDTNKNGKHHVLTFTKTEVWLDGTDTGREGYWVWSTTGRLITHLFWAVTQPDHYYGPHRENCLMYGEEYQWGYNDAQCERHVAVLCQYGLPSTPRLEACPGGNWIEHANRMYCTVQGERNWYDAKLLCERLGAHLPILDMAAEEMFLRSLITTGDVWLDASEEGHAGAFVWSSTGSPVRFPNWQSGEPNDYNGKAENCVEFGETYGWQWNDAPCPEKRDTIHQVICERYKPQLPSTAILG